MKRYKGHRVFCMCDMNKKGFKDFSKISRKVEKDHYPNTGKYKDACPKCGYYPWYFVKEKTK